MSTKIFIFALCFLFIIGCGQNEDSERTDRILMTAIESTDWPVQRRAIQELQGTLDHNPLSRKALIRYLFSSDVDPTWDLLEITKVLARAEQPPVSELMNAFRSGNSSYENLEKLLVVLGRMGPNAKPAVPFLLEQFDKHREDPEIEGSIRVVLANIGYESNENLATILSDIRNRTDTGKAEVRMMALVGAEEWVNDEIIEELVKWLDLQDESEEPAFAAIALGSLGQRAKPAAANLKKLVEFVWQDEYYCTYRIIYGLSLAKIDPPKSGEALRGVLKYMGSEYFGNHTDFAAMAMVDSLIDTHIIKEIVKALDHRDPAVVGGATWMLLGIGLDAREYTPKVLKILKENPDEDLREVSARALGYMADPHDIPTLEAILKKEQSEFVRDEITDTIRIIRLEEE